MTSRRSTLRLFAKVIVLGTLLLSLGQLSESTRMTVRVKASPADSKEEKVSVTSTSSVDQPRSPANELIQALDAAAHPPGSEQTKTPLMALVEKRMSYLQLPLFLKTLVEVGLADQLVIFALDSGALKQCQKIHIEKLCISNFGSQDVNGEHVPIMLDEQGGLSSWHHKGWMKTSLILKTLLMGYPLMFLDVDLVFFKDPFTAINSDADLALVPECSDGYNPYSRNGNGANLGLTLYKSKPSVITMVKKWLERRHPDTWDQGEFRGAVENAILEDKDLNVQMLERDQFPMPTCGYCNNWLRFLMRREVGWRDTCPKSTRDKFIYWHVAGLQDWMEPRGVPLDETLMKRHIMHRVYELKETDKWTRYGT